jgi:hypothetical protein
MPCPAGKSHGVQRAPCDRWAALAPWHSAWRVCHWFAPQATARQLGGESTATGHPLGSEAFLRDLEAATGRALTPQKCGPKLKDAGNAEAQTDTR